MRIKCDYVLTIWAIWGSVFILWPNEKFRAYILVIFTNGRIIAKYLRSVHKMQGHWNFSLT
jgi:hypothetical protein